jgi:hypothetical protein
MGRDLLNDIPALAGVEKPEREIGPCARERSALRGSSRFVDGYNNHNNNKRNLCSFAGRKSVASLRCALLCKLYSTTMPCCDAVVHFCLLAQLRR